MSARRSAQAKAYMGHGHVGGDVYQIIETYVVNKTGEVSIHRDSTNTQLVLTTCSNTNDKEQLVVMANLISKDDYS